MNTDEVARQLHDKATRGGTLSPEERACLEKWYAQQDQEENAALAGALSSQPIAALRAQVDVAVGQLGAVTHRIQALTAESETVRQENAALRRQLAQRFNCNHDDHVGKTSGSSGD